MTVTIRQATGTDAAACAALHAERISEGFLARLGVRFLARLYRRIVRSDHAFAHVAVDAEGSVVGFTATAVSTAALYREFVVRDGIVAALGSLPPVVRNVRRVWETLRYPAGDADLPAAEILAVAVAPRASGQGLGRRLVGAALDELAGRGVASARVVAGADNTAALALYRSCGFVPVRTTEVHVGVRSEVLRWDSPSRS